MLRRFWYHLRQSLGLSEPERYQDYREPTVWQELAKLSREAQKEKRG